MRMVSSCCQVNHDSLRMSEGVNACMGVASFIHSFIDESCEHELHLCDEDEE